MRESSGAKEVLAYLPGFYRTSAQWYKRKVNPACTSAVLHRPLARRYTAFGWLSASTSISLGNGPMASSASLVPSTVSWGGL